MVMRSMTSNCPRSSNSIHCEHDSFSGRSRCCWCGEFSPGHGPYAKPYAPATELSAPKLSDETPTSQTLNAADAGAGPGRAHFFMDSKEFAVIGTTFYEIESPW